ncbi:energy-coupled thiamine transporter ThiT [Lachnospiraceae bacterium OttesenSCG-928-D06]|nr:energy-coupled thiamine transporter ThiT [Lachnospiraceae bacterium OttesenSCG-928-D06]
MSTTNRTKKLVFSAAAIALATVIATVIKLPSLPAGGSATLFSMLVISLVGYWYGPVSGISAAFAYGVLQFITGPYVLNPIQVLLDYPLAFGALGLSGFFHNKKQGLLIGFSVGVLGRFIFHTISGLIFYTTYIGDASADILAIWASLLYNLSYLLPEAILTILLIALPPVRKMLARLKTMATTP